MTRASTAYSVVIMEKLFTGSRITKPHGAPGVSVDPKLPRHFNNDKTNIRLEEVTGHAKDS